MNSHPVESPAVSKSAPPAPWWKWLCCQNPFYILSAGCVVHGVSLWFQEGNLQSPWALMGLIGSYTVLLAASVFGIVKFGQVWDDARSIFVLILLLFVELALSFDSTFVEDADVGGWLLISGFCLAVIISEWLLLGLRIRLPATWRVPYYLMLALLFLYPFSLRSVLQSGQTQVLNWRLYLFSPLVAGTILSLLPAVRRGARVFHNNGTPWSWPMYPWTIFTVLIACLTARAYAICASFDPVIHQSLRQAMELQTVFAPFFLMPILTAIAVLVLEAGLQSEEPYLSQLTMILVVAGIGLSAIGPLSALQTEFHNEFQRQLGSPVFVSLWMATVLFAYAFLRKSPYAERCLNMALALHLFVGRDTVGFSSRLLETPVWPLVVLAGLHIGLGCWRHQPRRLVAGILTGIGTLHFTVLSDEPVWLSSAVMIHLAWLTILIAGFAFRDMHLKILAGLKMIGLAVAAIEIAPTVPNLNAWVPVLYLLGLTGIAMALAIIVQQKAYWIVALAEAGMIARITGPWFINWFRQQPGWRGLAFYCGGLVWLVIALLISYLKSTRTTAAAATNPRPSQRLSP